MYGFSYSIKKAVESHRLLVKTYGEHPKSNIIDIDMITELEHEAWFS